uniref:Uncharacterized protein n=1 Tax=Arundo donax TaxID=35708 RepID=A0A0A9D9F3_ARUDO
MAHQTKDTPAIPVKWLFNMSIYTGYLKRILPQQGRGLANNYMQIITKTLRFIAQNIISKIVMVISHDGVNTTERIARWHWLLGTRD